MNWQTQLHGDTLEWLLEEWAQIPQHGLGVGLVGAVGRFDRDGCTYRTGLPVTQTVGR